MHTADAMMIMTDNRRKSTGENVQHWRNLAVEWNKRSQFAAEWLQDAKCVADVGCGLMTLERLLPTSTRYIPIDLVPRDSRTIVVDLNRQLIPDVACDALAMLGVLEYLDDVPRVLAQLTRFQRSIFNYNHISINDWLWKLKLREKHVTWTNRYAKAEVERLIRMAGLQVTRRRKIRTGEVLYEVRPVERSIS